MAAPTHFTEANLLLAGSPGDDSVIPLPVLRDAGRIVSCWTFSADEIRAIAMTGEVWLSVWGGETAPPVFVSALKNEVIG